MSRLVVAALAAWLLVLVLVGIALFGGYLWLRENDSRLHDLRFPPDGVEVPSWAHVAPEQIAEAEKHGVPVAFENDLGMRFVLIPAGTFLMGSPEDEEGHQYDETVHEVTITTPFYMQITEVTNEQYRRFDGAHGSLTFRGLSFDGDHQPVVGISWVDASAFASWLTERDASREYRLPTEAEWEYACRAGTKSRWSWGESEAEAHKYCNAGDPTANEKLRWISSPALRFPKVDGYAVTAPVGSYLPNAWGLHDMHGNAWEWCLDRYALLGIPYAEGPAVDPTGSPAGGMRILRGGSWQMSPAAVRSAVRFGFDPDFRDDDSFGFRLVSPLPEPGE